MSEREISPVPDSPRPQSSGHYRADDDIELPPMPDDAANATTTSGRSQTGPSSKSGSLTTLLGSAVLMGAIVAGGWFMLRGNSAERQHPNWQHVSAAAEASNEGTSQLVHIDTAGTSRILPTIEVTAADANRNATQQVRLALMRNDLAAATAALQAAQSIPNAADTDIDQPQLTANSELALAIKEGRKELFQIELFDCCDEDGDVVEILVNDAPFATVPIMHAGTMLSIPLASGNNTVTLRGIHDGGGGVTVSFRTSRGDFFARYMSVGEEYRMEVTVK
jgi:flagellar basal body-associated protein FliL